MAAFRILHGTSGKRFDDSSICLVTDWRPLKVQNTLLNWFDDVYPPCCSWPGRARGGGKEWTTLVKDALYKAGGVLYRKKERFVSRIPRFVRSTIRRGRVGSKDTFYLQFADKPPSQPRIRPFQLRYRGLSRDRLTPRGKSGPAIPDRSDAQNQLMIKLINDEIN